MNEAAMKKSIAELSAVLAFPQRGGGSSDSVDHLTGLDGTSLEEAMDYLRLQLKYLVFDLEATRRENSYLRRMLENRRRREDDDRGPGGL